MELEYSGRGNPVTLPGGIRMILSDTWKFIEEKEGINMIDKKDSNELAIWNNAGYMRLASDVKPARKRRS